MASNYTAGPDLTVHRGVAFPVRTWQLVWYVAITIVGVPGNLFVGFVIVSSERKVRYAPFNMFLLSLATSDVLLSLVAIPGYLFSTSYFTPSSSQQGNFMCKTISGYTIQFWLTCVSLYTLTAMSLQRQRVICHPITARMADPKQTLKAIVFVWIFALLMQIPTPLGIEYSTVNPIVGNFCTYKWMNSTEQKLIYIAIFLCQYAGPLFIMVYSLTRTLKTLQRLDRKDTRPTGTAGLFAVSSSGCPTNTQWVSRRRRTVLTLVAVVVAFFICVTPNEVMYFVAQFLDFRILTWNSVANQIGVMLFITNSCVNPFLYAFSSKEFRVHTRKAVRRARRKCSLIYCSTRRRMPSVSSESAGLLRTV